MGAERAELLRLRPDVFGFLQEELARLRREKGEADGMLQILRTKVAEAEEDNFDLRANQLTLEAEIRYASEKKEKLMQAKVAKLESNLAFLTAKLEDAKRAKLAALNEAEQLMLERKRLNAKDLLLKTKTRYIVANQSQLSQQQEQQQARQPESVVSETAVQADLDHAPANANTEADNMKEENARFVSVLLTRFSRDLLTMLHGSNAGKQELDSETPKDANGQESSPAGSMRGTQFASTPTQRPPGLSESPGQNSMEQSPHGAPFSQSVFSQIAGHASAQAHASLLSFTMESNITQATLSTDRARELYDAIGRMLAGEVSAVALAPVLIKYLAAPTDLDCAVLSSVMRVMYSVMHHSERFQQFVLIAPPPSQTTAAASSAATGMHKSTMAMNLMEHPRITLPGLRFTSLDDYLSSRKPFTQDEASQSTEAESTSEQRQLRSKLLSALCRAIKNNLNEPAVAEHGLCVLCFWVDLSLAHQPSSEPDFKPLVAANVVPSVLLSPKGLPTVKAQAVGLLSQLLHFPEVFTQMEAETKKSLLFNRCAKMLDRKRSSFARQAIGDVRGLQRQVVKLFLSIILSFPSVGLRFVLENTRGLPGDTDGHRSVVFYVAQLLDQETFETRVANASGTSIAEQLLLRDKERVGLLQDAFALMALLARYVDLARELDGADQVQAFIAVLCFLSTTTLDGRGADSSGRNDSVSKTARALIALMNQ